MTLGSWLITHLRPGYEADLAAYVFGIILALGILSYKTYHWPKVPKKEHRHYITHSFVAVLFSTIFVFFVYSSYYYWYSNVSTEGITVCANDQCRWAAHIHAAIDDITICGQRQHLPLETGILSGPHTHKDNRIHWHDTIPVNPHTQEIIYKKPFTLQAFFEAIGWQFSNNCIRGTCTGTPCEGKQGTLHVYVNNQLLTTPEDYAWKEGDRFRIVFE